MARENITVVIVDGAPTASFDTVSRTLSLPNWPFVNVDQYDTQLCHEVGHALYTDNAYLERQAKRRAAKQNSAGLFTYINVIEDTRIERKMREAYPGVKRIFFNGRQAFAEHGPIFQIADAKHILIDKTKVAVASMKFIDRINLFYKIGAFIDIPFSAAEQKWLPIIDRAHSTENACEIAEKLWALAKETAKQEKNEKQAEQKKADKSKSKPEQGEAGDGDGEEGEPGEEKAKTSKSGDDGDDDSEGSQEGQNGAEGDDTDEGEEETDGGSDGSEGDSEADGEEEGESSAKGDGGDEDGEPEGGDEASDEGKSGKASGHAPLGTGGDSSDAGDDEDSDPVSETDEALSKALEALAQQQQRAGADIRNLLIKPISDKAVRERTVTAIEWVGLVEKAVAVRGVDTNATANLETAWNELYMPTAKHMAAEFTRKKTAKNLQHARTGKTGRLNMSKLASYQLVDDIFKHVTTVPNGQSHGIVMVIDGSSSMDDVFANVVDQTLLFANFAFLANIPFEAYMFTDRNHGSSGFTSEREPNAVQVIGLPSSGRLVGLVNTVTDRKSFKRQVRACLALRAMHAKHDAITLKAGRNANFDNVPYGNLGSTPLYAGMMIMERHVERLKRTLRLDKVMAIVVTDGQDTAKLSFTGNKLDAATGTTSLQSEVLQHQACVVRDTKTKQNFMLVEKNTNGNNYVQPQNAVLAMLFDVMKVRHDARGIMLYLVDNTGYAGGAAATMTRGKVTIDAAKVAAEMTKTKQFVVPNGVADLCVVLNSSTLVLQENTFAALNTNGQTAEQITQHFVDAGKRAGANRVFANTVIPFLA